MSHTGLLATGGKKIKPPPPPDSDPLSSNSGRQPYFPQQDYNEVTTIEDSLRLAKRFFLNQPVMVNVEGCGWLMGTVVCLIKAVESLTGSRVKVRYSIPNERKERQVEFPNHPNYIRPVND